jgi:hypothetical protein
VLEEEIEADPNVDQLREIIATARKKEPTLDEAIDELPPISKLLFLFVRELSRLITSTVQLIIK